MAGAKGHPLFAAVWAFQVRHEGKADRRLREQAAAGLHGRVLEIGAGTGANWPYLPAGVDYSGIEPDPAMLARARETATKMGNSYDLHQAGAEAIPFPEATFDAVLVTWTLCSVADVPAGLAEMRRVLKPGGELRFVEHVRPSGRVPGRLADAITPLWKRLGAGCHPNRRTADSLRAAGFTLQEFQQLRHRGIPVIRGVAHAS